jgi:hypothetical protein
MKGETMIYQISGIIKNTSFGGTKLILSNEIAAPNKGKITVELDEVATKEFMTHLKLADQSKTATLVGNKIKLEIK